MRRGSRQAGKNLLSHASILFRQETSKRRLKMNRAEKMALTAGLQVGSTIIVGILAYFLSLGILTYAIAQNVTPNYAYAGSIVVFVAVLAVWIKKLAVRIQVR